MREQAITAMVDAATEEGFIADRHGTAVELDALLSFLSENAEWIWGKRHYSNWGGVVTHTQIVKDGLRRLREFG